MRLEAPGGVAPLPIQFPPRMTKLQFLGAPLADLENLLTSDTEWLSFPNPAMDLLPGGPPGASMSSVIHVGQIERIIERCRFDLTRVLFRILGPLNQIQRRLPEFIPAF